MIGSESLPKIKLKRIRKLSQDVYNQIAAGEVIERPASLVKELVENSLDAGATRIDIDITSSSVLSIMVRDNGHGINKDDLINALTPHATSKLQQAEDLEQIGTLGFRGEALASIASVAKLQISSTYVDEQQGWSVSYHPGEVWPPDIKKTGHPRGTTVFVNDLFYNTPARRAFLRSDKTELLQIEDVVRKMAIGHQQLNITLRHQNKIIFAVTASSVTTTELSLKRLGKILGKQFVQHAIVIEKMATQLSLHGFIVDGSWHRSQADRQFLYVNGRYVKDKVLQHAIRQAYAERLPGARYSIYVLFLQLPAMSVDVNVHPTKHEIRFKEMRLVHQFVFAALVEALGKKDADTLSAENVGLSVEEYSPRVIDKSIDLSQAGQSSRTTVFSRRTTSSLSLEKTISNSLTLLGYLSPEYILAKDEGGVYFIDRHSCFSQMAKQIFLSRSPEKAIQQQTLLLPQAIEGLNGELDIIDSYIEILSELGFELTCAGEYSWLLRKIPAFFHHTGVKILSDYFPKLLQKSELFSPDRLSKLIDALCCFAAPVAAYELVIDELESVFHYIKHNIPKACGHGRYSWRKINTEDISNVINSQK